MELYVSKNLKRLRKERGMTQDELARRLNVSFQSVSKWERGESEPSLSMLPIIACLFNVSTDEIYGMDEIKRQQRIDELNAQIKENYVEHKVNNNIPLIQEVLDEYPDSPELMFELGKSYFLAHVDEEETIEYLGVASELFGKVIRLTDNEKLKEDCRYYLNLCSYYSGESAVAHEDSIDSSRELIKNILLADETMDTDRDMSMKKNIESLTLFLARQIWKLADPDCLYPATSVAAEKAAYLMKAADLLKWLYDDGDFFSVHKELLDLYRVSAAIYMYDSRFDEALTAIEKAAEHAAAYDTSNGGEHSSFLVQGLVDDIHGENKSCTRLLASKLNQERYDRVRKDKRFTDIEKKLSDFIKEKI